MSVEIRRSLVLSTAHLREATDKAMEAFADADATTPLDLDPVANLSYDAVMYGYQVWVGTDTETPEGIPEEFTAIFALARKHQCTWVIFDCDAAIVDELPHWEW